jgi:protein gp37
VADTSIEWSDKVWNPIRGCSLVSAGCQSCYAMKMAHRFSGPGQPYEGLTRLGAKGPIWTGKVRTVPEKLDEPLRWRKPSRVFVNSMSDLFHEDVPFSYIDEVFAIMAAARKHTFQVLTKRASRMARYFAERSLGDVFTNILRMSDREPAYGPSPHDHLRGMLRVLDSWEIRDGQTSDYLPKSWPLPNVWLGVSVENQVCADERILHLLKTPAAVRWLSVEPMIGPVDLDRWLDAGYESGGPAGWIAEPSIDWVVCGGESGPGARPFHLQWGIDLMGQCADAGVPFFWKQMGAHVIDLHGERIKLKDGHGGNPSEWPSDLRIRQYPEAPR